MDESLHEAAMRLTGKRGCGGGCSYINCPANVPRLNCDTNACLIRRIAQCSNADEQIEWLKQWQAEHPAKPIWRNGYNGIMCSNCGSTFSRIEIETAQRFWKFCPNCGTKMDTEDA